LGDAVEIGVLILGLAAFLLSAIAITLLGFGGAAGNVTGLIFWVLLLVLVIALALSRWRTDEDEVVSVTRRTRDRDTR